MEWGVSIVTIIGGLIKDFHFIGASQSGGLLSVRGGRNNAD